MPDSSQLVRFLQQTPSFVGLGSSDLFAIAGAATYREVEAGFCFCRQGAPAESVYVLYYGGCVQLIRSMPDGANILLRFLGPGERFGATGSGDDTYPFAARAVRWCQVLKWTAETMARLLARYPQLALNMIGELDATIQDLRQRCCELATDRVEQRIASALLRLAHRIGREIQGRIVIDVPLSRQELAEMTGTTVYSVSRTLSAWQRAGVVDAGRQWVAIRRADSLRTIAAAARTNAPRRIPVARPDSMRSDCRQPASAVDTI